MGSQSSLVIPVTLTGISDVVRYLSTDASWSFQFADNKFIFSTVSPDTGDTVTLPKGFIAVNANYSLTNNSILVSVYLADRTAPLELVLNNCQIGGNDLGKRITCVLDTNSQQQLQTLIGYQNAQGGTLVYFIWIILMLLSAFVLFVLFLVFNLHR